LLSDAYRSEPDLGMVDRVWLIGETVKIGLDLAEGFNGHAANLSG